MHLLNYHASHVCTGQGPLNPCPGRGHNTANRNWGNMGTFYWKCSEMACLVEVLINVHKHAKPHFWLTLFFNYWGDKVKITGFCKVILGQFSPPEQCDQNHKNDNQSLKIPPAGTHQITAQTWQSMPKDGRRPGNTHPCHPPLSILDITLLPGTQIWNFFCSFLYCQAPFTYWLLVSKVEEKYQCYVGEDWKTNSWVNYGLFIYLMWISISIVSGWAKPFSSKQKLSSWWQMNNMIVGNNTWPLFNVWINNCGTICWIWNLDHSIDCSAVHMSVCCL